MTTPDATVTITAANSGDATATSVVIRFKEDEVVDGQGTSITCPPGFTTDPAHWGPYACVKGVMGPGATATMVVHIQIPADGFAEPVQSITHAVEIFAVGVADPTPADTTATATVPVAFDTTGGGAPGVGRERGGGAEPGGGVTPGGTTPRAPQLTALSLSPLSFRAAASGPSAFAARARVGTLVTTRLSAAATETFRVERAVSGRRALHPLARARRALHRPRHGRHQPPALHRPPRRPAPGPRALPAHGHRTRQHRAHIGHTACRLHDRPLNPGNRRSDRGSLRLPPDHVKRTELHFHPGVAWARRRR